MYASKPVNTKTDKENNAIRHVKNAYDCPTTMPCIFLHATVFNTRFCSV